MYKKGGIAMPFDGAGIKETPKLAIPEKKPDTRYGVLPEYYLFRMQVELLVKTI